MPTTNIMIRPELNARSLKMRGGMNGLSPVTMWTRNRYKPNPGQAVASMMISVELNQSLSVDPRSSMSWNAASATTERAEAEPVELQRGVGFALVA